MRTVRLLTIAAIMLLAAGFPQMPGQLRQASAQQVCGETYTVLPGDTLSEIAERCETTVTAILEANPEIEDATRLLAGQQLRIPQDPQEVEPVVAISPACGPPGAEVLVLASGFPPRVSVEIGAGRPGQEFRATGTVVSDENGIIETRVNIPATAEANRTWVILVETSDDDAGYSAVSSGFYVTRSPEESRPPTAYNVQRDDTLQSIANRFGIPIDALLEANPGIGNPPEIVPGQRIFIPAQRNLSLTPDCGPPGSQLQVTGRNFPPRQAASLGFGRWQATELLATQVLTEADGRLNASLAIPENAGRGERWVAVVETQGDPAFRSVSNLFTVTDRPDPNSPTIYVVGPVDTLNEVAVRFDRTIEGILAANPNITNINEIAVGERLIIPWQEEGVTLTPPAGPAGSNVQVHGHGFPVEAKVEVRLGRRESAANLLETAITNQAGEFNTQVTIPASARPRERWVVVAGLSRAGSPRVSAVSNPFTVTGIVPGQNDPVVTIWPPGGPPGTPLLVSAEGFPPVTRVELGLGRPGQSLEVVWQDWTDLNGTFAAEVQIPTEAGAGESWVVQAETVGGEAVTAASPVFSVVADDAPVVESVQVFLAAPGQGQAGCGDDVVGVEQAVPPTQAPLTAAIEVLLSLGENLPEGENGEFDSGLVNALARSELKIESIEVSAGTAAIRLTGEYRAGGECGAARIKAQLEQTTLQFPQVQAVEVTVNGVPFEELPTQP